MTIKGNSVVLLSRKVSGVRGIERLGLGRVIDEMLHENNNAVLLHVACNRMEEAACYMS